MKKVLFYIWQLPQNLVGLLLRLLIKGEKSISVDGIHVYYSSKFPGGISLGSTIILGCLHSFCAKHERGHQIQSIYLGPLYLFIIGIPSIIWAGLYGSVLKSTKNGYFKFYTEKWADKLGGASR